MSGGLHVPCFIDDKPLGVQPIHIALELDPAKPARSRWECPHCHWRFHRRKPCADHMGLTMNKKVTCRVLIAADDHRRMDRAFAHDGFQEKR